MSGAGFSGERPKYLGGPMGIKALIDALNPWDIIKASARGFRWLFVGYKKRTQDASYQDPAGKLNGGATGYGGPVYAGNGEAATELRPSDDGGRGRMRRDTLGTTTEEDDRAGLLRNSGVMAGSRPSHSASPYRTYTSDEFAAGDDSQMDIGAPHRGLHPTATNSSEASYPGAFGAESKASDYGPGRPSEWDEEDTGYHPGIGGGSSASQPPMHPALRGQGGEGQQQWDMWSGAQSGDADSVRPPTYRTRDPRG